MAVRGKTAARRGEPVFDRQPPQSVEAEQAVLGAMLLNPEAVGAAIEVLHDAAEDVFYVEAHRLIYNAMMDLFRANMPVDTTTLIDRLMRGSSLDEAGGASYIVELTGAVPTSANINYYAQIVLESALLRRIITTCANIEQDAYNAQEGVDQLLDRAEADIFAIAQKRQLNPIYPVASLLEAGIKRIEAQMKTDGGVTGVATGIHKLDEMLSGFQQSDMIVLAARPSVGKTALSLNIASHATTKNGKGVLLFSLEMAKEQLVQRLLCMVGHVDSDRLRKGFLAKAEFPKLQRAADTLSRAKLYIDESANIGILELRSKARRHMTQHPVDLIIIDYLQLMSGASRAENRQVEIAEISRSIKGIARELKVPVVALSQLSREAEKDDTGMPKLSHLRESGAIEQDADVVLMLSRPPAHEQEGRENVVRLTIAKQRNGPTGHFDLLFEKNVQSFRNLTDGPAEAEPPTGGMREDYDIEEPLDDDDAPF
ncbi:MAG: replicative DNA helicase [Candidatus Hydrogenedentes bacterium]|nr:replicative DNA helicase [Candidatus Hydrogenedentota bacterium]